MHACLRYGSCPLLCFICCFLCSVCVMFGLRWKCSVHRGDIHTNLNTHKRTRTSVRKVVRAVMQRRFASPNEAGACSITPTSPRAPQHTHNPSVRAHFSHSPSGRVPASSGEWFRPLPALGQLQITEPSHNPTMHRQQPRSQTNPSARGDRHHHQMP